MLMRTIVIFRIGSLGDTVVALPCFHLIARSFPNFRRIVVTDVPTSQKVISVEGILAKSGLIEEVIYFPPPPRKIRDFVRLWKQVRAIRPSALIYIADRDILRTLRDICFFKACGIGQIIGAPLSRDLRLPRVDPQTGYVEREAMRLARCLEPLGAIDLDDPALWDLRLRPDEISVADRMLGPLAGKGFIAVNIGGKVRSKDWGYGNWTALLRLLAAEYSRLPLTFVGSADEYDPSARLAAVWPGPTLNLCGALEPRECAAALKQALLFVGHDSGPLHLAAAMGVRCVGIFGNFNKPESWHPMGPGHRVIHNMRGIDKISADEVCGAVHGVMKDSTAQTNHRHTSLALSELLSTPLIRATVV
jgi:ADP-heptose:LPS heptosyltransferase